MEKATVNRILPFSSVDGPGNRSVVFLQGCNMNCKYCHNPETRKLCVGCGSCVKKCSTGALFFTETGKIGYDASKCVQCDTCIHTCPHDSSPKTSEMTVEAVFEKIKRQIPFIRGITVSGGECTLWPEFITELFTKVREKGLTTLLDSNGLLPLWEQPELMAVTDGVMLDMKAFDRDDHYRITDTWNDTILKNAVYLAENKKLYEIRCVIVPDLYDAKKSVRAIGKFLAPYLAQTDIHVKLIAYRPVGVREQYAHYRTPDADELKELMEILQEEGFRTIILI